MSERQYHRVELKKPLLLITTNQGSVLGCGYLNPETFTKTGEACAIVTGVADFEAMMVASVVAVSSEAAARGVQVGDTGEAALAKMG